MARKIEGPYRCRVEQYYNKRNYDLTGMAVHRASTVHYFINDNNNCVCGKSWL